jgi:hypothetical protein
MYFRRKTAAGPRLSADRREPPRRRLSASAGSALGRFEELQASGQLERLLSSGARFAAKAISAKRPPMMPRSRLRRRIRPALVFERLWEETGCRAVIADLAGKHGYEFRAGARGVPHRVAPGCS